MLVLGALSIFYAIVLHVPIFFNGLVPFFGQWLYGLPGIVVLPMFIIMIVVLMLVRATTLWWWYGFRFAVPARDPSPLSREGGGSGPSR